MIRSATPAYSTAPSHPAAVIPRIRNLRCDGPNPLPVEAGKLRLNVSATIRACTSPGHFRFRRLRPKNRENLQLRLHRDSIPTPSSTYRLAPAKGDSRVREPRASVDRGAEGLSAQDEGYRPRAEQYPGQVRPAVLQSDPDWPGSVNPRPAHLRRTRSVQPVRDLFQPSVPS